MTAPLMAMIVAVGRNGVIGRDGDMPWRLSSDLKWFRKITMSKPVVMGRKTLESIGGPLPGRANLVVSRDPAYRPAGATVFPSLEAAVAAARQIAQESGLDEFIIGGGGTVYAACMGQADKLYVTKVDAEPEGDTVFPAIPPDEWELVREEAMPRTERDSADALWQVWRRHR
jgi:dihydrofolate reductase